MVEANFCNKVSLGTKFLSKSVTVQKNRKIESSLFKMAYLGFINMFTILSFKHVKVKLKYQDSESVLRGLFLVSKISLRIYVKNEDILKLLRDNFFCLSGFLTFFTNKGYLLDIECFLHGIGGKAAMGFY